MGRIRAAQQRIPAAEVPGEGTEGGNAAAEAPEGMTEEREPTAETPEVMAEGGKAAAKGGKGMAEGINDAADEPEGMAEREDGVMRCAMPGM